MKQILVPTDFSETARNAVDFAVQTAKVFPAKINLLHSYNVSSSFNTDFLGVNKEYVQRMMNDISRDLEKIKEDVKEKDGIEISTTISGLDLDSAIRTASEEEKTDLVVMGTLGASGIREKLWGSRTSSVIGKTTVPLMVIPNKYKWKKPQRILFATNQFERDPKILNFLFELAGLYMANVQVTVFTDADDDKAEDYVKNKVRSEEYDKFLRSNFNEDTLISVHLYGSEFEETLQNYIDENNIDILVMVTYQPNFWNRIFSPSKTKRMSYQTRIPLLAIPAKTVKE